MSFNILSKSNLIIVAGMHRSGTSMITSYLENIGVSLGDNLLKGDQHNKKGYFEDEAFLQLNRTMLADMSSEGKAGWKDWGYTEDGVLDYTKTSNYLKEGKKLVSGQRKGKVWGMKDPRASLLLDFWLEVEPNAKFIFPYRNPWEVKSSTDALNAQVFNENPHYGFESWKLYNQKVLEFYRKHPDKCILISSNGFVTSPKKLAEIIEEKFKIPTKKDKWTDYSVIKASLFNRTDNWKQFFEYKQDKSLETVLHELHNTADFPGDVPKGIKEKKVTVVVPCYNQGHFLKECLTSVISSNNEHYDLIVVNDGSTDGNTLKVFKQVEAKGIKVIHQKNMGLSEARNTGIKAANTPYILPLDADNKINPELITQAIEVLDKTPETGVVYSNTRHFGDTNAFVAVDEFNIARMLAINYIDALAVFRIEVWKDNNGYVPMELGYEDWEFWLSAYKNGWQFHHLDGYLFDYRVRKGSMVDKCFLPENQFKVHDHILTKFEDLYKEHFKEVYSRVKTDVATLYVSADYYRKEAEFQKKLAGFNDSKLAKLIKLYYKFKHQAKPTPGEVVIDTPAGNGKPNIFKRFSRKVFKKVLNKLRQLSKLIFKNLYLLLETEDIAIVSSSSTQNFVANPYERWMELNDPKKKDLEIYKKLIGLFEVKPLISVVVPVYNPPVQLLKEAIESVKAQIYTNWELCISDDNSSDEEVKELLRSYAASDPRIKVHFRDKNGHISENSNSALALATGDYIALLDHDDLLPKEALYEVVQTINDHPEVDFIYSDEDKVDEQGKRSEPYFKTDFCLDSLLSRNYITHLAVLRKSLVDQIGGFRKGFEGSQDYDLFLRVVEQTDKIVHIPKILYHWRMHTGSVTMVASGKNYAYDAGEKTIKEFLAKRGEEAKVELIDTLPGFYSVRYKLVKPGKVSIIIPTKDQTKVLKTCIDSIVNKSSHQNYEIILLDNNSSSPSFFQLVEKYKKSLGDRFVYVECKFPFNYSKLMNIGCQHVTGDYILLLNNDTEVITGDWMEAMMEQAQRSDIGCVGATLLFHNESIQHAGVIMGLGGVAGHCFVGKNKDERGYHYSLKVVNNFSAVTAACLMVRTKVFKEVHGFEESLEVEFNDVDFCLKVGELGLRHVCLPHVQLFHYESLSRGNPKKDEKSLTRHRREAGYMYDKWGKYIENDPCYNPNLTLETSDYYIKL